MTDHFTAKHLDRSQYKYWHKDQVRFNDLDALGHVGSIRVNEYFAGVRTKLFKETIPDWPDSDVFPVLKLSIVQYEAEINYPADLDVGLLIEKFGNTSLAVVMAVFDSAKCLALCKNVFVFIDDKTRLATAPSETTKNKMHKVTFG